jgi:hypothetical protein
VGDNRLFSFLPFSFQYETGTTSSTLGEQALCGTARLGQNCVMLGDCVDVFWVLRGIDLVYFAVVSEESVASIFRVEQFHSSNT